MSSVAVGLVIFVCIFGGAVLGMVLRALLPAHHLSTESKDVVKLGTGLIATMAALVLGLLVGSAKSSYDAQKGEVVEMAANIVLLDRVLTHYGSGADEARATLKLATSGVIERIWSEEGPRGIESKRAVPPGDMLYDQIHRLVPQNDAQKNSQSEAQSICGNLFRTRLMLFAQSGSSLMTPLLVVMVFWLSVVFVSFGLFAPTNATVLATLLASALSVSGAIFLILEMDRPFIGMIRISEAPMRSALEQLGK